MYGISLVLVLLLVTLTMATESFRHERSYSMDRQGQIELLLQFWNCLQKSQSFHSSDSSNVFCPSTSDGWFCWEETIAGEDSVLPCPIRNRQKNPGYITRRCLTNGTWDVDPLTGKEKITYQSCPIHHLQKGLESLETILNDLRHLETLAVASSAAYEECVLGTLTTPRRHDESPFCPRTFDGWGCWNDTSAGVVAYIPCPTFITGFSPNKFAYRKCNSDGSWFRHPDTNRTWSNYTTCVDTEDLQFRQQINNLYIIGYFLSVVALTVSFLLFCYFKQLNCTRITIHKNLFVSFIINNVMWIIWYSEVVQKPDVPFNNGLPCQILHVVVNYFMVSNYLWMFCEGLYLHTLMVVAFVKEDKILRWFYLLGWGLPGLLITIYTAVRGSQGDRTTLCWLEESVYQWILSGPVILSMLINFIFLINIVHVLVTKLRAPNSQDTHQTRKAVRATLILIPLLGLHYVVTPFRPEPKTVGEAVYEITSACVTSFQCEMQEVTAV